MSETPTIVAQLDATARVRGRFSNELPTLLVRCREGEFEVYVSTGMVTDDGGANRLRWDDAPPEPQYVWSSSTGLESLFTSEPVAFIHSALKARRLRFEFTPHASGPVVATFALSGLEAVMPRLRQACPAAFEAPLERALPIDINEAPRADTAASSPVTVKNAVVRVGGGIAPPTKIFDVRPTYSAAALSARAAGVVILELTVDGEGAVAHARVLRSIEALDQAALDAVRQWRYTPTLLNGVPASMIMTVTVNFTLP